MPTSPPSAYQNLKARYHLLANLKGANSILYMDSMTVMKPGSEADRSEQSMALAIAGQKLITDPEVGDWLDEAEAGSATLSPHDQTNLRLMRREWVCATAVPEALVSEIARAEVEGNTLHTRYRDQGDWAVMKPVYARAFELSRELGEIYKDALGFSTPYEALLDRFSPGLQLPTVEREFAKLERILPGMISEAIDRQKAAAMPIPLPPVPVDILAELGHELMLGIGFDENRGVLYTGEMHPLSGGTPDDSRLTTRYRPANPLDGLYTIAHEAGHSLYEQNTPIAWRYQPAGHSMGMDIHESQSMIMELQACRTGEYLDYLAGRFSSKLGAADAAAFTADNMHKIMSEVEASPIRIYADELTYPGHIILRFNLERGIISGNLSVDDLPAAWNDGMKKTFGITPDHPAQGHMQDVHWPTLSAGYFPAYTLGAMGAAQFFAAAEKARPDMRQAIGAGRFTPLCEWLRDNVHSKGSLLSQDALYTEATGEPLNAAYYLNHLSRRYLGRDYRE